MHITKQIQEYIDRCVLYALRGSHAHNMYIPSTEPTSIDDVDTMGVYIAPVEKYLGISTHSERQADKSSTFKSGEFDYEFHEFRKFLCLLIKSNPNVIGMLWLKPHCYIKTTVTGRYLIANREVFSSKRAYHSFTGYAHAQLHKMTHLAFEGYMGEKRKNLVTKFGYDTKNAAHCLRLLQMGIEFLATGELNVWREDADKFLTVKRGEWTLEQVKTEADRLFKLADEALVTSPLPYSPNKEKANEICMDVLRDYVMTGKIV